MSAAAAKAGGSVISAYGTYQQGKMDDKMGKYNARISEQDAVMTRNKGYRDEAALRRSFEEQQSSNRVAIGKSGVAFSGSPMDALAYNAAKAELDALNVRYSSEVSAKAHEQSAKMSRYTGKMAKYQAKISALSQLMGAGAQGAS